MNSNALWILAVVMLAVGFGAGFRVEAWRWDSAEADRIAAEVAATAEKQTAADKAAVAWEKERADMLDTNKKLQRKLAYEISNNRVYSDCVVPSTGVSALAAAVSGIATGEPVKPLP